MMSISQICEEMLSILFEYLPQNDKIKKVATFDEKELIRHVELYPNDLGR